MRRLTVLSLPLQLVLAGTPMIIKIKIGTKEKGLNLLDFELEDWGGGGRALIDKVL